ncbi:ral guanine nucleotide dissociation stimulator-like [Molossus molossus]|uniref:ral guanine nucleotide dissociation stimulator-like n=1 Tax=Molossus molossus TaxID=27622 RepID=UPI001747B2DC|nr:ral guanine nucleotide dissociation stimulator-like [Molossus molossus]
MRGARPGQEQVVRCRKPGRSVMFMALVTAGRKGRRVLGPSPSAHLLIGVKRPAPETVQELADGFTYAFNRYQTGGHQARKPVQSRSESSSEDILEVLARGPNYTTYQVRVQVHQANDAGQCQSECAAELTLNLREACRMRALQEGTLEKMVVSMVPAFPRGKIPHISTFMSIHPAFSRAQLFLDQLFTRSDAIQVFSTSGNMMPYNDQGDTPQDQLKKAVASVMGAWPDQVQGIGPPLRFPGCKVQQPLVQVSVLASYQVGYAHFLWVKLKHLKPTKAKPAETSKNGQSKCVERQALRRPFAKARGCHDPVYK